MEEEGEEEAAEEAAEEGKEGEKKEFWALLLSSGKTKGETDVEMSGEEKEKGEEFPRRLSLSNRLLGGFRPLSPPSPPSPPSSLPSFSRKPPTTKPGGPLVDENEGKEKLEDVASVAANGKVGASPSLPAASAAAPTPPPHANSPLPPPPPTPPRPPPPPPHPPPPPPKGFPSSSGSGSFEEASERSSSKDLMREGSREASGGGREGFSTKRSSGFPLESER